MFVTSSSAASSQTSMPSSSTQLHTFLVPLFLKLDDDNYLIWQQQILAHVNGLQLFHFLDGCAPPLRFLTTDDVAANKVNPAFLFINNKTIF